MLAGVGCARHVAGDRTLFARRLTDGATPGGH